MLMQPQTIILPPDCTTTNAFIVQNSSTLQCYHNKFIVQPVQYYRCVQRPRKCRRTGYLVQWVRYGRDRVISTVVPCTRNYDYARAYRTEIWNFS
jgi:hypothetical protein